MTLPFDFEYRGEYMTTGTLSATPDSMLQFAVAVLAQALRELAAPPTKAGK